MCVSKLKVKFNLILDEGDKNKDELKKELDGKAKEYYEDVASQRKQPFRFQHFPKQNLKVGEK